MIRIKIIVSYSFGIIADTDSMSYHVICVGQLIELQEFHELNFVVCLEKSISEMNSIPRIISLFFFEKKVR